jgi:hypothetical protein
MKIVKILNIKHQVNVVKYYQNVHQMEQNVLKNRYVQYMMRIYVKLHMELKVHVNGRKVFVNHWYAKK